MFSFSHLSVHGIQFGAHAWRAQRLPLGVVAIDVGHILLWPLASSPIFYLFTTQLWPHWFQIAPLLWWLISDACGDSHWSTVWERQKASVDRLNGRAKCVLCLLSEAGADQQLVIVQSCSTTGSIIRLYSGCAEEDSNFTAGFVIKNHLELESSSNSQKTWSNNVWVFWFLFVEIHNNFICSNESVILDFWRH